MKKIILSSLVFVSLSVTAFAQDKKQTLSTQGAPAIATTSLTPENVAFKSDIHDFGNLEEGPAAEHVFTFTNTGKEPLLIQRVQPSCGCTTPDWTKDAVAPGKTGMIKASYGTQGRPG